MKVFLLFWLWMLFLSMTGYSLWW